MNYRILFILFLLTTFIIFPHKAFAKDWYYPMDRYQDRLWIKDFGTLINDEFYKQSFISPAGEIKGKEQLFPFNRFYGYHAAVDLEVFEEEKEKDVPVYAVSTGIITYIGQLDGYGGIILQKLDEENRTALYGHVKISNLPFSVGDEIKKAGQRLTFLGDAFSKETSKERQHLHFGIYKGSGLYFKGHESSEKILREKWENSSLYLKERNAKDPNPPQPTPHQTANKSDTMREGMQHKVLISIVGIAVVLASITYLVIGSKMKTSPAPSATQQETPAVTRGQQAPISYKAGFAIFTHRTFRVFTAAMYHNQSSDVYIAADNPNIVNIKKSGTTWNDFFKTLPFKLTKECLTTGTKETFCTNKKATLQFYLNGKQDENALDKQISAGDQLLVSYGNEGEEQIQRQLQQIPKVE